MKIVLMILLAIASLILIASVLLQSGNSAGLSGSIAGGAEQLFGSFGISVADAINIFLHQSLMVGGLPFEVRQPRFNAETEAAMQEARDISSGKISAKRYDSARALLEDLDNEC